MVQQNTDFGRVADDLRRAATSFALLTSQATVLGRSLQAFREFELQLRRTIAIAGGTEAQFQQLSSTARGFALATTSSAADAGAALQNLAQAGFSAEESLAGLGGVLLLADSTLADVGAAADVLSSNIRAFGLETSDSIRISNLFVAAQNNSLATLDKLTFAMRQVGPVAEVAGLSIEETTGFLGQLFNIGLRGEQAGTSLRNVIVRLIRPTGEAAAILREFGIATIDATGNFRGLETVLQDIAKANLGEAQLAKLFENEALAGAIRLLKVVSDGTDTAGNSFRQLVGEISGTNDALDIALQRLNTFDGSIRLLQNALTDAAIELGEALAPAIKEIALTVREVLTAFRELDDEQKQQIAKWIGIAAAAAASAAALNAILLIFGGLLGAVPRLVAALGLIGGAMSTLAFNAGLANTATLALATGTASTGLGTLAAVAGRVALGVTGIGIAAGAAYIAWNLLTREGAADAESLRDAIKDIGKGVEIDAAKFNTEALAGINIAKSIAAAVGSDVELAEAASRIKRADDLINNDLVALLSEGDIRQAVTAARTAQTLVAPAAGKGLDRAQNRYFEDLAIELEADAVVLAQQVTAYTAAQDRVAGLYKKLQAQPLIEFSFENFLSGGRSNEAGNIQRELQAAQQDIENFRKDIGEKQFAAILTALETQDGLSDSAAAFVKKYEEAKEFERLALIQLVEQLSEGTNTLGAVYQPFVGQIAELLRSNETASQELLDQLATLAADDTLGLSPAEIERIQVVLSGKRLVDVLATIFAIKDSSAAEQTVTILNEALRTGQIGVNIDTIARAYVAEQREVVIKTFGTLTEATNNLDEVIRRQQRDLAGSNARNATTLGDALRELRKGFIFDLEDNVSGVVEKIETDILEVFGTVDLKTGMASAFEKVFENFKEDFSSVGDFPGFADIADGRILLEEITAQIDETTTPEEADRIAQKLISRYKELLSQILTTYVASFPEGALDATQLAQITELANKVPQAIEGAVLAGLADLKTDEAQATTKFKDKSKGKVPDAVKAVREVEDAFDKARDASITAQRSFVEAFQGLGISARSALFETIELQEVLASYDDILQGLRRELEDLKFNPNIDSSQLGTLQDQYAQTIDIIEAARDAEVKAATSFEAQMERRSKAIDQYITDLRNLSAEQGNVGTQFGAGVLAGLAEFQRDLIGLFDIAQNATTSFAQSIAGTLGDVIFEGENLLDAFKKTLLNISRQVFEGFTNAFIQQVISSATGGGGSVFGNLLQPSKALAGDPRNSELPGIGDGPFAALFGKGGDSQVATQLTTLATQIRTNGGAVTTNLQSTATGVQSSGQTAAQSIIAAGNNLASAIAGVAGQVGNLVTGTSTSNYGGGVGGASLSFGSSVTPTASSMTGPNSGFNSALSTTGDAVLKFGIAVNDSMKPLFDLSGASYRTESNAPNNMSAVLAGPFAEMQSLFGKQITINDAIAKSGTSRERNTPNSRHFQGDALDLNVAGFDQTQLTKVVDSALQAGFTGFGFGDNILHVDQGPRRSWDYGNENFGGAGGLNADSMQQYVAQWTGDARMAAESMGQFARTDLPAALTTALPNAEQFSALFTTAIQDFGTAFEGLGVKGFGTTPEDGFISDAFDPNAVNMQQINATIAQLNAALTAAGSQIQIALQTVSTGTQTGGQQVALALQTSSTQIRSSGTQTSGAIQQTGRATGQALGDTARVVQQANQQIAAAARSGGGGGGIFSSLAKAFTSSDFLLGALSYVPMFFKEGGYAEAYQGFAKSYATGGDVMGAGTGTSDDILAWLSNGEFVVNTKATNDYRPLLEAINSGMAPDEIAKMLLQSNAMPAFANGGLAASGLGMSNVQDFGFTRSSPNYATSSGSLSAPRNIGNSSITVSPVYNITISNGDQKSADRFARSASQHAKDMGQALEAAKKNL